MAEIVRSYFSSAVQDFGLGWNRFWFTPLDRRPLEVLRITFGAITLYLLATLIPDLNRYFVDGGLLPVDAVVEVETLNMFDGVRAFRGFSYLDYLHTPGELLTAHLAGMAAVLLFTLGLFTGVTSVLSLLVMLSTVHRAPMITSGLEPVVTMVLFYLCLGPQGTLAAIASRFTGNPIHRISTWTTVALRLIQVHVALLYGTMALSKLYGGTWWNGTGVWWLIARPESRLIDFSGLATMKLGGTPLGVYLINGWSHAVVLFELAYAVLIWNRLTRPLLIVWSIVHWLALGMLLGQLPLAVAMIAVNIAFISPLVLPAPRGA